jgi:hypothetical protein
MKTHVKYRVPCGEFWCNTSFDPEECPEYAAEDCAANFHLQHDGWESPWPLDITLLRDDGSEIATCEVDRESVPSFSATKKETP